MCQLILMLLLGNSRKIHAEKVGKYSENACGVQENVVKYRI